MMNSRSSFRFSARLLFFLALWTGLLPTANAETFELRDFDRVVFLGDGLIEQEQYAGWVELMLTTSFPNRNVTFRNLGWSADNPDGASRFGLSLLQAGYEPEGEGWKQLQKQIELTKPTVVIFGYGMAASLEDTNPNSFVADFEQLIQFLRTQNSDVRMVFCSPIGRISVEGQNPANAKEPHDATLVRYRNAIARLAGKYGSPFVDLLDVAQQPEHRRDAIHVNSEGYRRVANAVGEQLGVKQANWQDSRAETLRQTILRKNQWFFHRSRPANMAYVFGFRKREQGQNAVEIPQFDALIEKEEKRIAKLRGLGPASIEVPKSRTKSAYAKFTAQPHPKFTAADGWEVTLWAENPMLNKPIQMNFDPSGRLWVASSEAYPMIEVGQTANDRIIVLEDSNGDGKADKSSVFADGLLIPTGVLPSEDGVYVAQSTDLLHLQDTNGDGKADRKTRVLSGFGTEDTHHNLHTLRWGPDGRLYMNQSVYTRTDAETPRGVTRLKAGGGFRFHPHTMRMQIFFAGLWNSWGHQFDKWGRSFLSDGAGFNGLAYAFPGAQFRPVPYGQRILDLISPGRYPKFCSLEIVSGDSLPKDWQETIVTCDFRANRVTRFSLVEKDSGYETVQEADLLRTSESTFRPIDIKQGPDGALYIADWSNPIINHGEVDFRDPRRDRWHGRIWRVAYKGNGEPPKQSTDYTKQSTAALLQKLTSRDRYARDKARRVLIRRSEETQKALSDWTAAQDGFGKLQALWLHQAMNTPDLDLLEELLAHSNAAIRAAATRTLGDWSDPQSDLHDPLSFEACTPWFRRLVKDAHPQVRLEAIVALTAQKHPTAARIALEALALKTDRFIEFALSELLTDVARPLLDSLGEQPLAHKQLEFTLASVPPQKATGFLRSYLASNPITKDGSGPWIELIGKSGGQSEIEALYATLLARGFDETASLRVLTALAEAKRLRKIMPQKNLGDIADFLKANSSAIRNQAIRLTGLWGVESLSETLLQIANNASTKSEQLTAIDSLREMRSTQRLRAIQSEDTEIIARVLSGLASLDPEAAITRFLDIQSTKPSEQDLVAYWRAILSNKKNKDRLPARLQGVRLSQASVRAGLRVAREGGRNAKQLVDQLKAMLGESFEQLTPQQIAAIANDALNGDAFAGEKIYRKQELACVTCHAVAGVGGKVGPDLSSIGASAPIDYLAESLYMPNAKVKENYHSTVILDADGQQHTGIESGSTAQEVVLRLADNTLFRIPRDEVELQKAGPSLMPAGLVERLSRQEQVDLIAFLSKLGKPGDFDTSQQNVARRMEIFPGTHRAEQDGRESIVNGRARGWKPVNVRVNGDVTKADILEATKQHFNISLVTIYLRTRFQVSDTKSIRIELQGAKDAILWLNRKKLSSDKTNVYELTTDPGMKELVVRLDARELPDSVKVICDNVSFETE